MSEVPLPWERLLWNGHSAFWPVRRERYVLTDVRLVSIAGEAVAEIALYDIGEVRRTQTRLDRLAGTSTLVVASRRARTIIRLHGVRRGDHLAALIELLSGDPRGTFDRDSIETALAWDPRGKRSGAREALAALAAVLIAVFGVGIGLHGKSATVVIPAPDDPIAPDGQKRTQAQIVAFMQSEVMPWARLTLGPIKGGADRITCETCHGRNAQTRGWQMPAVAALPAPELRESGWELYGGPMDAQIRNAIYGYRTESEKQSRANYMREVVMPGMAGILRRPPYDFTKPYEYNRSHLAFGCYHCHRVK